MSIVRSNESTFEAATIQRLHMLSYQYKYGPELERDPGEVVLHSVLRENLHTRYPSLTQSALDAAIDKITRPEGPDTLTRNLHFHTAILSRGFELSVERAPGSEAGGTGKGMLGPDRAVRETVHIHPIDWQQPERNHFLVVNQLHIAGPNRIPDLVVYVNGLPLVVFELKNPWDESANVDDAYNQLQHYSVLCPRLFEFNALCVASDGNETLHGMWCAGQEWYAPWKSVDGLQVEATKTGSMATLINGLFPKRRLLDYIRHFILFEVDKAGVVKKGAKYHQFFAVNTAVERTLAAFKNDDRRIGVIWHTTGSGKSLSMAFLVGILRHHPDLGSPAFVIQVDRNDLDDQLHDQFAVARHLVGPVQHAESVDQLRALLRTRGSEVIFTTVEKFALKRGPDGKVIETGHPLLSDRSDIIIIADEAHRSQYGFLNGFARYMSHALPNARRLGFTGTPLTFGGALGSLEGSETVEVFGNYIHTYDILQAQKDGSTVPIYYSPRKTDLHLKQGDIDQALTDAASQANVDGSELERRKSRWAALAEVAGARYRIEAVAKDILQHFQERSANFAGKAMVVCMTRKNCVRLYDELKALPGCPEIKIVMTGNLKEDPKEWSEQGHITSKPQRESIKKRMVDPDDPLKMVIVCDMWLTGTDIPCLHTLYVDKPMRGLNMVQAISRVNRVFRGKPHGLIVDYIGIGDELREATDKYRTGGGKGEPAPDISEQAVPLFLDCLDATRALLPEGRSWGAWRGLSPVEFEDLHSEVYAWLADDDARRDAYVQAEHRLTNAWLLVRTLDVGREHADELLFHQRVRKQILKTKPGAKVKRDLEETVRDLVDDHVASQGVADIFTLAGIKTPDISILDDKFLQTFKDRPHEDLRLKLLHALIADELVRRERSNLAQTRTFRELLENTIQRYHQRLIDAATVVQTIIEIREKMDDVASRALELGLSSEELAFYDAVHANYATIYDDPFLRDLIHDVVQAVKGNLKVDWTEPHREDVKAAVRSAVRRVLRRRGVKPEDFEGLTNAVLGQAVALWKDWPRVA